ncbi:hypothetical protein P26059A_0105 [Curvibacter phage P26059A]|nr:hypothetical protein P26059A_0105 [Curvibacter phage P26059A]
MDIISMQTAVQISGAILGWIGMDVIGAGAFRLRIPYSFNIAMAFVGATVATLVYNAS